MLLAVAGAATFLLLERRTPPKEPPVLAVRMFRNLSADRAHEYFTIGMTEQLHSQLSKISAASAETSARHVVEGTVRSQDDRPEAVRVSSGFMYTPRAEITSGCWPGNPKWPLPAEKMTMILFATAVAIAAASARSAALSGGFCLLLPQLQVKIPD